MRKRAEIFFEIEPDKIYLSSGGNDSAPGTYDEPRPLSILLKDTVYQNDTIFIVKNGLHEFYGKINVKTKDESTFIIIRAETLWGATITAPESTREGIEIHSDNVIISELVFTDKYISDRSNDDDGIDLAKSIDVYGKDVTIKCCVIHDLTIGIGFWSTADNFTAFGNIIYNIGWYDPKSGRQEGTRGHGIYGQTNPDLIAKTKAIIDTNIIWGSLNHGLHMYSQSDGKLDGLKITNNIMFSTIHRTCLVGGTKPMRDLDFKFNTIYGGASGIGYNAHAESENINISNNKFIYSSPPVFTNLGKNTIFKNNKILKRSGSTAFYHVAPSEEQRFDFVKKWQIEGNVLEKETGPISRKNIGAQALNKGTESVEHEGFERISLATSESIIEGAYTYEVLQDKLYYFVVIGASSSLVYSEETSIDLRNMFSQNSIVQVSSFLDPLVPISELNLNEGTVYKHNYKNSHNAAKFKGSNHENMFNLPDSGDFFGLVFKKINESDSEVKPKPNPDNSISEKIEAIQEDVTFLVNKFKEIFR